MKDRVREAVFNLVGPAVVGGHAIDLFAGTGALGLEALSRGAKHATFIERHFPTADLLRRNVALLGMEKKATVIPGDAFAWFHRRPELGTEPWLVFCSPPYDYYASRGAELRELMAEMIAIAPPGSVFVVEFDKRFEPSRLPQPEQWDIRRYPPAIVGVFRKP
jgi:16S rRNA (guanine966-N2)-methyltransferase